jgi:D-aminopeptidase
MRPRCRDRGLVPGVLPPARHNLLSDIADVTVGHHTVRIPPDVCTGVTLVDPGVENLFRRKLPAAVVVGNGFGKLVGSTQVNELGTLESPIAVTNTLAVGPVMRGVVDLVIGRTPDLQPTETINAVVGETSDAILNTIHRNVLGGAEVNAAYQACTAQFELGAVGAGAGTTTFAWKGGVGSASRRVDSRPGRFVVGTLVVTNFGGSLLVTGVPVGRRLTSDDSGLSPSPATDGSCVIVLATDAPLDSRQLTRVGRRALVGMTRTGSHMANGSGDYVVSFSTAATGASPLADADLDPFFLAAVEATEESIYDALFTAVTTHGRDGHIAEALPADKVMELVRRLA